MKYKSIILGFIAVIVLFVLTQRNILAENVNVVEEDINVETIPDNPEPYDNVDIKISSFATDLNRAVIEWKIAGKTVLSGIGKTTYSLKTAGPNTSTVININIIPEGGVTIAKQIIIQPSEIEMLWQAVDSYTPAFYKGKALPIQESKIKVVAFPNTVNVAKANKKNMIYAWSRGDKSAPDASGYGKDSFTFANNVLLDTEHITLSASTVDSIYSAVGTLDVNIEKPSLLFYKKSPINGVLYNEALVDEASMTEDEMTIIAEPYFMNRNSNDLQYSWKINNEIIDTPNKRTELTIRPTSRGGYATIGLSIESITKLFQSITNNLQINL